MTFKKSSGFTMIELLMAIILLGILGAVGLPKILDLNREGKLASVGNNLSAMREGINIAKRSYLLRCGAKQGTVFYNGVLSNRLTWSTSTGAFYDWYNPTSNTYGYCPTTISTADKRLWDSGDGVLLDNPFVSTTETSALLFISTCAAGRCTCTAPKCSCDDLTLAGITGVYNWIFDQGTGEVVAGTNVAGECDK